MNNFNYTYLLFTKNIFNSNIFFTLILSLLFISDCNAVEKYNVSDKGVSLHGYDPVSYFSHSPVPGNSNYSYLYDGVTYNFNSEGNLSEFKQNPNKYIPQFGGYCAYGVRLGKKFDIEPDIFEIVDGKLYLLLNRATKKIWEKDKERNIKIGSQLWNAIEDVSTINLEKAK